MRFSRAESSTVETTPAPSQDISGLSLMRTKFSRSDAPVPPLMLLDPYINPPGKRLTNNGESRVEQCGCARIGWNLQLPHGETDISRGNWTGVLDLYA